MVGSQAVPIPALYAHTHCNGQRELQWISKTPLSVTDPEYRDIIGTMLAVLDRDVTEHGILNSRFDCLARGAIDFREICQEGCGGLNSKDDPDYCLAPI